jgi:hypothetical protein
LIAQKKVIGPAEEAQYLLGLYDGKLSSCLEFLKQHFNVIQAWSQLLLTICTLALTITRFSGTQIVQTNLFARYSMVLGIVFVLLVMVILLLGGLRIRWVTQMIAETLQATLSSIIRYRNRKTRLYFAELSLLVVGLTSYVVSVMTFLLYGSA